MSVTGKEYKLAIRIAGVIDKSFNASLMSANGSLKKAVYSLDSDFTRLDRGFDTIMGVGSKAFHAIASASSGCCFKNLLACFNPRAYSLLS